MDVIGTIIVNVRSSTRDFDKKVRPSHERNIHYCIFIALSLRIGKDSRIKLMFTSILAENASSDIVFIAHITDSFFQISVVVQPRVRRSNGGTHASFMYMVRSLILQCLSSRRARCASLGDAKATRASPVGIPLSLYRRITFSRLMSKSPKNSMISLISALKGTFSSESTQPGLPKPST